MSSITTARPEAQPTPLQKAALGVLIRHKPTGDLNLITGVTDDGRFMTLDGDTTISIAQFTTHYTVAQRRQEPVRIVRIGERSYHDSRVVTWSWELSMGATKTFWSAILPAYVKEMEAAA